MRSILGCDIDGTLTTNPLHCGGLGTVGKVVWGFCKVTHLAEWIMRRAEPRSWVVACVRSLRQVGWRICIITAREERYRKLTEEWLSKHNIPCDYLFMRERGEDSPIEAKADHLPACHLYLDDQAEIIEALADRLGVKCPQMFNVITEGNLLERFVWLECKRVQA